jgi:hypothetical protein
VAIGPAADQPLRWKAKPIAGPTSDRSETTAGGISAASEGPSQGMKPIKLVSGYSPIGGPVGSGVVPAGGATSAPAPSAGGGWNKMRVDTFVTPTQATAPADPFSDPFGDRHATRAAATLQLQGPAGQTPNPAAPGANQNAPGFNPVQPSPAPAPPPGNFQPPAFPRQPLTPPTGPPTVPGAERPLFDPLNPPMPNPPTPTPPDNNPPPPMPPMNELDPRNPLPMPGGSDTNPRRLPDNNSPSNKPCDRVYDELNCCDSAEGCRKFMQGLLRDRLSHISLDIAPRFDPADEAKNEEQRAAQSKFAGSRQWHRRGVTIEQRASATPLAEGSLYGLQNSRAIIMESSGQKRDIPLSDLSEDDLCFISGWWKLPPECAIASTRRIDLVARGWTPSTMNWTASSLCHKPLYFEQVQHERYGHSAGPFRQPWIDGVHFFGSCLMLPYNMALDPPWECEYDLGYYRPGNCAPWQIPPFPFSPRAAMAQAGFVVGGIYIMP